MPKLFKRSTICVVHLVPSVLYSSPVLILNSKASERSWLSITFATAVWPTASDRLRVESWAKEAKYVVASESTPTNWTTPTSAGLEQESNLHDHMNSHQAESNTESAEGREHSVTSSSCVIDITAEYSNYVNVANVAQGTRDRRERLTTADCELLQAIDGMCFDSFESMPQKYSSILSSNSYALRYLNRNIGAAGYG